MNNTAIVGVNWGDEGKGRIVDLFSSNYDIVIRYQGGGNAGHTVMNEFGTFALHLLPSGIFRKNVVNILGNGVALDPISLLKEMKTVRDCSIPISPENLKISSRASLLMPWHVDLDVLEENRLANKKYGSTKQGIAPFYSDKYQKKTVMAGEVFDDELFMQHIEDLMAWKDMIIRAYGGEEYTKDRLKEFFEAIEEIKPYICDVTLYLNENRDKRIMFEAQLGSLRDIDYGIYPYTTSSNTLASYAPIGAGCPDLKLDKVIGVAKAYSTCVGEGPFVSEMFDEEAEELRKAGSEYGAKTGRPRRVGAFDVVATRYGVKVQGCDAVAITKLDVLSYMDKIPICVSYLVDGKETDEFPFPSKLNKAEPIIRYFDGWKCDISDIRKYEDLPIKAREYIEFIEKGIRCPLAYISVGPERESIIYR
ncbi:MAG: adenylosuccinate synthase [Erysipelotrichaceae bacterium]|nr:adenylosuccinate synthase [Erysipelotrichaceae bacterium]